MNSKIVQTKSTAASGDIAKYIASAVALIAGVFVWFWFSGDEAAASLGSWSAQLRGLAVLIGVVVAALLFLGTAKGHAVREFLAESRFELRKVVWPTRQEAMRTTWVVAVAVVILSLMLGGFDFVIQWLTQSLLAR